jgi:hypothetical protein
MFALAQHLEVMQFVEPSFSQRNADSPIKDSPVTGATDI